MGQYYQNPNIQFALSQQQSNNAAAQMAYMQQQQHAVSAQYAPSAGPPEVVPFQISLTENPDFNLSDMPNLDDWIESVLKGQV
jgi:hypothetical protein